MHRRTTMAAIALTATVTVLAGCGGSSSGSSKGNSGGAGGNASQAPAAELSSAINKLSNGSTLTTTLKLGASAGQIESFAASQGSSIKAASASALASSSVTIEAQANGTSLSSGGAAYDATVIVNGKQLIGFRDVKQVLYLQADLQDLLNSLNESSVFQEVQGEESSLPTFAKNFVAGKWISVPTSTVKQLAGSAGATSSGGSQGSVAGVLKSVLTNDVTATRISSSGGTDTLKLTSDTKTLATNLTQGLSEAIPLLGSLGSETIGNPPNPSTTLTATVSGGALSSLTVDVAQFAKNKTSASLPIELAFSQSGASISAPSGATPVDTSSLTQLLGAFGGGLGG